MFREIETKQIKSAKRVMEVLEYFTAEYPERTISDVVRDLKYPQSSASELLHCLASLGYLDFDPHRRTFTPTAQVAVLGSWILPTFFQNDNILQIMKSLNRETGELVVLATVVGLQVRYIHVCQATNSVRMVVPPGAVRPLLHTSIGRLLLSTQTDDEIRRIVLRLNAEAKEDWKVSLTEVKDNIEKIRQAGFSVSLNAMTKGGGMLAVLLPNNHQGAPLALGIGGASNIIGENQEHYLSLLRQASLDHSAVDIPPVHDAPIDPPVFVYRQPLGPDGLMADWGWRSGSTDSKPEELEEG